MARTRTPPAEKLSRREREIMNAVFALDNRATADDIRARLTDPPSYSAVRAMLVRLEAKGYLRHTEDGLRYVYSATASPASARRAALRQCLQVFFAGSPNQMMTSLLTQESWTREELDALQAEIDRLRKGRDK
jgi:predicted transcriptional regulator